MSPRFERVSGSGVDTNHDVKPVGTYNKRGKIYIDKRAARELNSEELRAVEIHERIELTKRLEGKPYSIAHRETEALFPFSPTLKDKLHSLADTIIKASYSSNGYNPPIDTYDSLSLGGAVEPDPYDDLREELIRRKVQRGSIRPISVDEMSDEEIERIIADRDKRDSVESATHKALAVKDGAQRQFEKATDYAEDYIERKMEADLAGREAGENKNLQPGMIVTNSPKDLNCPKCGRDYKSGDKVFKKIFTYYCPIDGATLQAAHKPATDGFKILSG